MYGLKKVGNIKIKHGDSSSNSRLGIGLEKLDRDLYDMIN